MIIIVDNKLASYILKTIPQEDIYAHYMKLPVDCIRYCLADKANKISNPLRIDNNPSLGFKYDYNGKLRIKDFASDIYNGDIFDTVGLILRKNPNNKKEFIEICKHIIDTLINNKVSSIKHAPLIDINKLADRDRDIKTIIPFTRNWNEVDKKYFVNTLRLPLSYLEKQGVYPLSSLAVGNKYIYFYKSTDPAYVYFLYDNRKKIYFPLRTRESGKARFITNNSMPFDFYNELVDNNEILVITKSRKDKLVIDYNLNRSNVTVIPLTHESTRLTKDLVDVLCRQFKHIILNVDYDKEGLMCGFYHNCVFNIPTIFLGNNRLANKEVFNNIEITNLIHKINRNSEQTFTINNFYSYVVNNKGSYKVKDMADFITKYNQNKTRKLLSLIYSRCNLYEK